MSITLLRLGSFGNPFRLVRPTLMRLRDSKSTNSSVNPTIAVLRQLSRFNSVIWNWKRKREFPSKTPINTGVESRLFESKMAPKAMQSGWCYGQWRSSESHFRLEVSRVNYLPKHLNFVIIILWPMLKCLEGHNCGLMSPVKLQLKVLRICWEAPWIHTHIHSASHRRLHEAIHTHTRTHCEG